MVHYKSFQYFTVTRSSRKSAASFGRERRAHVKTAPTRYPLASAFELYRYILIYTYSFAYLRALYIRGRNYPWAPRIQMARYNGNAATARSRISRLYARI